MDQKKRWKFGENRLTKVSAGRLGTFARDDVENKGKLVGVVWQK